MIICSWWITDINYFLPQPLTLQDKMNRKNITILREKQKFKTLYIHSNYQLSYQSWFMQVITRDKHFYNSSIVFKKMIENWLLSPNTILYPVFNSVTSSTLMLQLFTIETLSILVTGGILMVANSYCKYTVYKTNVSQSFLD